MSDTLLCCLCCFIGLLSDVFAQLVGGSRFVSIVDVIIFFFSLIIMATAFYRCRCPRCKFYRSHVLSCCTNAKARSISWNVTCISLHIDACLRVRRICQCQSREPILQHCPVPSCPSRLLPRTSLVTASQTCIPESPCTAEFQLEIRGAVIETIVFT